VKKKATLKLATTNRQSRTILKIAEPYLRPTSPVASVNANTAIASKKYRNSIKKT